MAGRAGAAGRPGDRDPFTCDPVTCDPAPCDPVTCDPVTCDPAACDPVTCDAVVWVGGMLGRGSSSSMSDGISEK